MRLRKYLSNHKIILMGLLSLIILVGSQVSAQVGVSTIQPKTQLDIEGALSLREGTIINLNNGFNNNISLGANPYSLYRISGPTDSFYITGIVPLLGASGQIVVIQNTTSAIMFINHNSPNSSAANNIYVPGGKDLMVRGRYASVTLQYDAVLSKWVLLNKLNHVETWYSGVLLIADGLKTTLTVTSPGVTPTSNIAITLVGFYSTPTTDKYNIFIEYVEAQTNQFVFRINNTNPDTQPGPNYSAVQLQYAYTIVK